MKKMKKITIMMLIMSIIVGVFSITGFAKTTTRNYDIFTIGSKNLVQDRKVDYFDVGGGKKATIGARYGSYVVVPNTVWTQGVQSEINLLNKTLYFDYWVADKKNNWVAGGTKRLGDTIKTPLKGKRIYITTRIEASGGDFVKKGNKLYAQSINAQLAQKIKYAITY